jgi:hypothetical protein
MSFLSIIHTYSSSSCFHIPSIYVLNVRDAELTSWSWALLEKAPMVQLLTNYPAFYETRRFITVFTRALHWSLLWASSIQSIPHRPVSLKSVFRSFVQRIRPGPSLFVTFGNKLIFYGEDLLAPRPTSKLEDHPLSATLHNWRPSPPSAAWGRVMPW